MKKSLNIREVPVVVMRELKVQSARKGITIREFVLGVLAKKLGVDEGAVTGKGENFEKGVEGEVMPSANSKATGKESGDHRAEPRSDAVPVEPYSFRKYVEGQKCFCGAKVFEYRDGYKPMKWKCEGVMSHTITPKVEVEK